MREARFQDCRVCAVVIDKTSPYYTDTLRQLDWTGVLVAGGAVLGALLPLPDALYTKCFPHGIQNYVPFLQYDSGDALRSLMRHYHGAEDYEGETDSENLWDTEAEAHWGPTLWRTSDSGSSVFKSSDIDIFLYGMNAEQAERKIEHILAVLGNTVDEINRTPQCVTFVRGWPHRNVQV